MYGQIRYGSKFIKQSKLNRVMRMKNLNKKKSLIEENAEDNEIQTKLNAANETRAEGRRFVDIVELGKNLKCTHCSCILSTERSIYRRINCGLYKCLCMRWRNDL